MLYVLTLSEFFAFDKCRQVGRKWAPKQKVC
jgi:hypothetical protein